MCCHMQGTWLQHKNCFVTLYININCLEINKMEGRMDKLLSLTAIGTMNCDLAQGLQDFGAILPMRIIDMNMDIAFIEFDFMFEKEQLKFKPSGVLRVVDSVASKDSKDFM